MVFDRNPGLRSPLQGSLTFCTQMRRKRSKKEARKRNQIPGSSFLPLSCFSFCARTSYDKLFLILISILILIMILILLFFNFSNLTQRGVCEKKRLRSRSRSRSRSRFAKLFPVCLVRAVLSGSTKFWIKKGETEQFLLLNWVLMDSNHRPPH
jgi:hypothetical protein